MRNPILKVPPALRYRRFALLWAGLLVSTAGSQMQLWALYWHIRVLSDQPIAVSGIGLARILPVIIFSLIGGLVADHFNRRLVMYVTQTTMTLVAVMLGLLTVWGHIQLWHIYVLTAIQAIALAFDGPARQAIVPNLIENNADLPSAFSMTSIAFDVGAIVGPGLSGIVIASLGQSYTYFINAVSFLAVLIALALMGQVEQQLNPQASRNGMQWSSIREGIQFIASRPVILSSMLLDFWATFFSSANTLLPFFARDILKVGAQAYGWLAAAQSIGAVTAATIMSQLTYIRKQGYLLLTAVMLFGVATALFGVTRVYPLTMLALILVGAGDAVSTILRNTIRQLQTPDYLRGRMTSVNQIFFQGGPQLGEIEAGLAAQFFGVPWAIISGGLGCLLAIVLIDRRWPQLRCYNGDEPVLAGELTANPLKVK